MAVISRGSLLKSSGGFCNSLHYIRLIPCVFYLSLLFFTIFPLTGLQITKRVIEKVCCAASIAGQPLYQDISILW